MFLAIIVILLGFVILFWSADKFVLGSASTARFFRMPTLLIGMVILGFGTSAPEMVISVLAALQANPGLALGNAYGSNITNIALILGLAALINPISIHSQVLRKELPILTAVTVLAAYQIYDGEITRLDSLILLAVFGGLIAWTIWQGLRKKADDLVDEIEQKLIVQTMRISRAITWLITGLIMLIVSSRMLIWGALEIARCFGVSDLITGLTIVAVGTSLPELASSVVAVRKGEFDLALGNILGSNLFNTLAVVGIAGTIHPIAVGQNVFYRDIMVMLALTISLFVFGWGFHGKGRINRVEGALLLAIYLGYMSYLVIIALG